MFIQQGGGTYQLPLYICHKYKYVYGSFMTHGSKEAWKLETLC